MSAGAPLVTVGLPVFNGERFLARALDSLLAQQFVDFEIHIFDNGSTDATVSIADSYAARDPRVRVSRSALNVGVEANFARALAAASGSYFMWAGCDDWWASTYVSRLVSTLESRPDAVVAMSAVERVDETGRVIDVVRHAGASDPSRLTPWQLTMLLAGGRPYHLFIYGLYRTPFIQRAFTGFAPVVAADRLFMCRVAMAGGFGYVEDVLHRRLVRQAPLAERYAEEPIGRLWRGSWARWKLVLAAGSYLYRSPVLPRSRRIWIPAVVLRFAKATLGHTLTQAVGRGRRSIPPSPVC